MIIKETWDKNIALRSWLNLRHKYSITISYKYEKYATVFTIISNYKLVADAWDGGGYRSYNRPDSLFSKDDLKILDDLRKGKNIIWNIRDGVLMSHRDD